MTKILAVDRIEEILRRGAKAGQRRWRSVMLQRRTGYSYDTVRASLNTLQARGLIGRAPDDTLDWLWLKSKK